MTINMKIFSPAEAISLFRLMTSVRPLTLSHTESTFRAIRKDKLEKMWNKVVVACFEVFLRNLLGLTVEYQEKPRSEQLVCGPPDYEQRQPNIQSRCQRGFRNQEQNEFITDISTVHMSLLIILSSMRYSFVLMRPALPAQRTATITNLLKPSGFFTYHQVLTFKNSTWCSLCVQCFVRISEQTATFALYSIN